MKIHPLLKRYLCLYAKVCYILNNWLVSSLIFFIPSLWANIPNSEVHHTWFPCCIILRSRIRIVGFGHWWLLPILDRGLFHLNVLILIPAWILNRMLSKVWDGIIHPFFPKLSLGWNYSSFPKRQRLHRWRLGIDSNSIPHFTLDLLTFPHGIKFNPCY